MVVYSDKYGMHLQISNEFDGIDGLCGKLKTMLSVDCVKMIPLICKSGKPFSDRIRFHRLGRNHLLDSSLTRVG